MKQFVLALGMSMLLFQPPSSATTTGVEDDEFAGLYSHDRLIDDDDKQRYFLIGREGVKAPRSGYKLLLVLPGGAGNADFNAFVKRIHMNVLEEDYLVAQLVAPV